MIMDGRQPKPEQINDMLKLLDITNNEYWVDENKMPLSILEILA